MKVWYEIRNSDNALLRKITAEDEWLPPGHKYGDGFDTRIIEEVIEAQPDYDASTHVCNQLDPLVGQSAVTIGWVVVPTPTPQSVPLWAFRLVLEKRGMVGQIDSVIAALPAEAKIKASVLLGYKDTISRGNPLIDVLGARIGLTSDAIDAVFKEAAAADEMVSHEVLLSEPQRQSVFQALWAKLFGP